MSKTFSKWYDFFMSPLEKGTFKTIRKNLIQRAEGSVLEIGSGTGINFPYYKSVTKVTAIEPRQFMIEKSIKRKAISSVQIEVQKGSAEMLPYPDNSFDTVVVTLALCTIPDPKLALKEMARVCKPGGKILLFEHVKMSSPFLGTLQDWLTPFWKKICDGCCLNRDTVQLVIANDMKIIRKTSFFNGLFVELEIRK